MRIKLTVFLMVIGMVLPGLLPAAEVLTEEDFVRKVVVKEDFLRTADNFIILFDASTSMNERLDKGKPETKYDVAKKILKQSENAIIEGKDNA